MVWRQAGFLANLPTHATRASRSPRFRPCSLKYAKITPVLQAIVSLALTAVNYHYTCSISLCVLDGPFCQVLGQSDQEEADTKIVRHALDATASGATEIRIHSQDTDVFILCLRRYPDLCQNTVFVTGKGQNYREINLQPIICALGPLKTAALPAFHDLTGADNTGSFSNKGKATCWNVFKECFAKSWSYSTKQVKMQSEHYRSSEQVISQAVSSKKQLKSSSASFLFPRPTSPQLRH